MKKFSYNKLYYLDFLKEKKKKESLDKYMEDNKNKIKSPEVKNQFLKMITGDVLWNHITNL